MGFSCIIKKKTLILQRIIYCISMHQHTLIGIKGEDAAAQYMRRHWYKILDRNWRVGHLEMDVICKRWRTIAFVEVKARTTRLNNQLPESYVDEDKKRHMVAAAKAYMKLHGYHSNWYKIRFDIIGLDMYPDGRVKELRYYKQAFLPRLRTIHEDTYTRYIKHPGEIDKNRWANKEKWI